MTLSLSEPKKMSVYCGIYLNMDRRMLAPGGFVLRLIPITVC